MVFISSLLTLAEIPEEDYIHRNTESSKDGLTGRHDVLRLLMRKPLQGGAVSFLKIAKTAS